MKNLNRPIKKLRILSFFLFLIASLAIVLSLLVSNAISIFPNFFAGVQYDNPHQIKKLDILAKAQGLGKDEGYPMTVKCDYTNEYCQNQNFTTLNFHLGNCTKYYRSRTIKIDNQNYSFEEYKNNFFTEEFYQLDLEKREVENYKKIKKEYRNKLIYNTFAITEQKDIKCIKNHPLYKIYKFIPQPFDFIYKTKISNTYKPATQLVVNPFINGELSISNLVKRYPINYLFKPLMFISALMMILYWLSYQKIFSKIKGSKKINKFVIFGIASSFCLFFHIFFLGTEIDTKIFSKIRRIVLILFLIFEITAQYYLVKEIFIIKKLLDKFIYNLIVKIKIIFICIIILSTIVISLFIFFTSITASLINIIEWNYFLVLLLFYFLSSIMWKRNY